MGDDALDRRLAGLLAAALGDPGVIVRDLQRLSGGASRETWSFDAVRSDGEVLPLIVRRDPPALPRPCGMSTEAAAFRAARAAGVPEPLVLAVSDDPAELGAPYLVMERIAGETIGRRILRDPPYQAARPLLAGQCGQILARIHAIPVGAVPGLERYDPLEVSRAMADKLGLTSPAVELGYRWLARHRREPSRITVVHGDFRNGNLIVGREGIRAVLDWEIVHLGDPMEDLGWLCTKAWRFGAAEPVGGFGGYAALFDAYERESGRRVDPHAVRWWEVFGSWRWAIGCMTQAQRHLSGAVRSVELAALGRKVCEQEYDLLELLARSA